MSHTVQVCEWISGKTVGLSKNHTAAKKGGMKTGNVRGQRNAADPRVYAMTLSITLHTHRAVRHRMLAIWCTCCTDGLLGALRHNTIAMPKYMNETALTR
mmetsp:Transcript_143200/g.399171  ORF Transcript_143200/g.399171 Transcript_143200/m.399171 type:complete len:100 (+) Transcript_143200:999-1298(+)